MVACADSEEEVWETLRKDVFYSSGEVVREYLSQSRDGLLMLRLGG